METANDYATKARKVSCYVLRMDGELRMGLVLVNFQTKIVLVD